MTRDHRRARRRFPPTAGRIRAKLILLHTLFSLALAALLLVVLRAPVQELVAESEQREARLALSLALAGDADPAAGLPGIDLRSAADPAQLGIGPALAAALRVDAPGDPRPDPADRPARTVVWDPDAGVYHAARARSPAARSAATKIYLLLTLCLLGVYGAIALTLEVFVLPRQVYGPIERLRAADEAVQAGARDRELIPDPEIPPDELGEIMRSRNASILKLRDQEAALNQALGRIETVAAELKRKNHLLEAARRNLADQDRLASLGMMSAGIAHELNTPLAVLKGSVEQLAERPGSVDPSRAQLMLRVVQRLERLSESLLDFARVRPPSSDRVAARPLVEEAWTLVSLDRDAKVLRFENHVPEEAHVTGDPDRLTQVLVNLLRNAVDAFDGSGAAADRTPRGRHAEPAVRVTFERADRDGRAWASLRVVDNGPGFDAALLPRLFEPFATTRLDSHGTGLGLAVAEGIVREHGGVLLARNLAPPDHGAEMEIMLPLSPAPADADSPAHSADAAAGVHSPPPPPTTEPADDR